MGLDDWWVGPKQISCFLDSPPRQALGNKKQDTEADWHRRHRRDVASAVADTTWRSTTSTKKRALRGAPMEMDSGILDELAHLSKKRRLSKLQAINDNSVLDSELRDGDAAAANTMAAAQRKRDIKREIDSLKISKILSKAPVVDFNGMHLFAHPCFNDTEVGVIASKRGLVVDAVRTDADVFLVPDPGKPGLRIAWIAALKGARIGTSKYILSGGRSGACVKYERALSSKRFIWVSPGFCTVHPDTTVILEECMRSPGTQWKKLGSQLEFVRRSYKVFSTGRLKSVLGLATLAEKRCSPVLRGLGNVFDSRAFLTFISKVDLANSSSGMCDT